MFRSLTLAAAVALLAARIPGDAAVPIRDGLTEGEQRAIAIYERMSPSVVSVANRALVRDFFSFQVYEVPRGAGSGFVWDEEGHIVSNFHVVQGASSIQVSFPEGGSCNARVVGVDPEHDIAVLKIESDAIELSPIPVGRSAALRVGRAVYAIGNPFGLDTSISAGIVSALGRSITAMTGQRIHNVIQTDAAINPGNSGGPLLDSSGSLVGINTAIISTSGSSAGVGFAVPSDVVNRVVPQLIKFGRVRKVGLGVLLLPEHITMRTGVKGVAIRRVFPDTGAEAAGLKGIGRNRRGDFVLGDVIMSIDGERVTTLDELTAVLDRYRAGDTVTLECRRDGKNRTVKVKLQALD